MRRQSRELIARVARIVAISTVISAGFGALLDDEGDTAASVGTGAFLGFTISTCLMLLEVFVFRRAMAAFLRRLPFVPAMLLRSVVYLAVLVLWFRIGFPLFQAAPIDFSWTSYEMLSSIAFGGAMSIGINFFISVNSLLGRDVLSSFLTGRYHKPRLEERIVMVLDLEGSTALAERIGDVRFLQFLDQFFRDIAMPILEHGGQIYKYVGDGVIVTWPIKAGLRDADALRCWFAMQDAIERRAAGYRKRFDAVPRFRAGLHIGTLVVGEMGEDSREIAYLGDTLNTAARLEQACRESNRRLLLSGDLLSKLVLPPDVTVEALGDVTLRGKQKPLALYTATRKLE